MVFINVQENYFLERILIFFGIQDLVLLALLILFYSFVRSAKHKYLKRIIQFFFIVLFAYLIPLFAATFEVQRVLYFYQENGDLIDGFNLLYVWFRFPLYWLFGIGIIVTNYFIIKKRVTNTKKSKA